jgi:hypothetical protein
LVWPVYCDCRIVDAQTMLKISIIDRRSDRRLVVEGKLVGPWLEELRNTWRNAGKDLRGRKLVIDLSQATVIGQEGQDAILEMMNEGAKFACCGVLTRYVVKKLARRCHGRMRGADQNESIESEPAITEVQVDAAKEHF